MDVFEELKKIDARVRYLGKEIRHVESRLQMSSTSLGEVKDKSKKSRVEENVAALIDYKNELEKLLIKEVEMRQKLWLIVSVLPRQQMIDIANYIILEHMSIQNVAEILSYSTKTVSRLARKTKEIISAEYENPEFMKLVDIALSEDRPLAEVLIDFDYCIKDVSC